MPKAKKVRVGKTTYKITSQGRATKALEKGLGVMREYFFLEGPRGGKALLVKDKDRSGVGFAFGRGGRALVNLDSVSSARVNFDSNNRRTPKKKRGSRR